MRRGGKATRKRIKKKGMWKGGRNSRQKKKLQDEKCRERETDRSRKEPKKRRQKTRQKNRHAENQKICPVLVLGNEKKRDGRGHMNGRKS